MANETERNVEFNRNLTSSIPFAVINIPLLLWAWSATLSHDTVVRPATVVCGGALTISLGTLILSRFVQSRQVFVPIYRLDCVLCVVALAFALGFLWAISSVDGLAPLGYEQLRLLIGACIACLIFGVGFIVRIHRMQSGSSEEKPVSVGIATE